MVRETDLAGSEGGGGVPEAEEYGQPLEVRKKKMEYVVPKSLPQYAVLTS